MPSDADPPEFTRIEWSNYEESKRTPTGRTVGFLLSITAVVVLWSYQWTTGDVAGWSIDPTTWLFLVAVFVAVWYLLLPIGTDPDRRSRLLAGVTRTPLRTASFAFLVALVAVGGYGAWLARTGTERAFGNQPPAFTSAPEVVVAECVGTLSDGRCHGTLTHPLGTGPHGTDMVRLIIEGATITVQLVSIVGLFVCVIALVVGAVAGYAGGRVDDVLMRYVDVQGTVPAFVVYVVLIFVVGRSLFVLILVFGLLNWGSVARTVRSEVQVVASENYVRAAKNYGVGHLAVLRRHVLPNVAGAAIVATTQLMPRIVLIEAALAFMGLTEAGGQSWGHTIGTGFDTYHAFHNLWWVTTVPVLFIIATVVALTITGDALRDVVDPETDV